MNNIKLKLHLSIVFVILFAGSINISAQDKLNPSFVKWDSVIAISKTTATLQVTVMAPCSIPAPLAMPF